MNEQLLVEHVDAIHAVDRDEFVAERDRRVRRLRKDGHREEATALGDRRKPTVPAWAVNQLARREQDMIAQLIEAGGELRTAQRRATSGRGADALRPATRRVRDMAADLASRARELLHEQGAAPGHVVDVQQTLFAAAVDPQLHETLRRGVFTRPVETSGFNVIAGLVAVPDDVPEHGSTASESAVGEGGHDVRDAEERDRRLQEERAIRDTRRRTLERQRADLQRSIVRHERRVDRARTRADDLQARANEAAADVRTEQEARADIANELEDVERRLRELEEGERDNEGGV